jgi:hypothetical protein
MKSKDDGMGILNSQGSLTGDGSSSGGLDKSSNSGRRASVLQAKQQVLLLQQ